MINGAAALAELVRPGGGADEFGAHRMLPVLPELSSLLPGRGLRRGSTVAVATGRSAPGSGGTSLLLALLAAASRSGSWCAVVGVPALGVLAAAESGIVLERLALVPHPGPEWPTVVAALIDGVDVVVTAVPGPVSASITSRLVARARQRGSVLMPFGRWDGADVTLQVMRGMWEGLGSGHGRLRRREVTITARGRGAAARPREITLWMPGVTTSSPPDPAPGIPSPATPDRTSPATPDRVSSAAPAHTSSATFGGVSSAVPGYASSTAPGGFPVVPDPASPGALGHAAPVTSGSGLSAVSRTRARALSGIGLSAVSGRVSPAALELASRDAPGRTALVASRAGDPVASGSGISAASRSGISAMLGAGVAAASGAGVEAVSEAGVGAESWAGSEGAGVAVGDSAGLEVGGPSGGARREGVALVASGRAAAFRRRRLALSVVRSA